MSKPLDGRKIAVLVANGFDQDDFVRAQRELVTAGATQKIISTENGLVNSWLGTGWGHHFPTDAHVSGVLAADYDGVFIPGGRRHIDKLKDNAHAKRIMRGFFDAGKPMMLLGCAVEMLAACDRATDTTVTGDADSETLLRDAGATWIANSPCADTFLATATSGDKENPIFTMIATHFEQEPEILKQAA